MFTSTWYGTYSFLPSFPPTFSPYFVSLSSLAPRAPDYLCYVLIAPSKSCNSDNSSLLLVRHPNHSWPIKIQKVSHKLRRQPEREQVREREREITKVQNELTFIEDLWTYYVQGLLLSSSHSLFCLIFPKALPFVPPDLFSTISTWSMEDWPVCTVSPSALPLTSG